jgi:O-acetylhomoserine (thiol)-lyase
MPGSSDPGFDTLALHAGAAPDPATGARAVPIHLSTSFVFESSEHAASLFNMERSGHVYSRISNPTNAVLEERIAALEGGWAPSPPPAARRRCTWPWPRWPAPATHIVASSALYGGAQPAALHAARFGIDTTFVKPLRHRRLARRDPPEHPAAVRRDPGQPGAGRAGHPHRQRHRARRTACRCWWTATFTTPWLMKPFDHGADLVYHSATKFLSGHGTVVGGCWSTAAPSTGRRVRPLPRAERALRRLPRHGVQRGKHRRRLPAARAARGPARLRRLHEPAHRLADPAGHRDLPLRMARHVENTRKIVAFLAAHPMVARVGYPELEGHPSHALAKKLLPRGCGAVFSFDLKGSRAAGPAFIEALKIFSHLANVGDCRSLVIHPASTTHFRMDDAALARAGIGPGTIRLSIGLEDAGDLIDDLKRALKVAEKAA